MYNLTENMSNYGGYKVKKLLVLTILLLSGAAIIFGHIHWNHKISAQGEEMLSEKEVIQEEIEEVKEAAQIDVTKLSSHLPEDLQEKIKTASEQDQSLHFVIYGTSEEKGTWSEKFVEKVKEAYGENLFTYSILSTGEQTTRDIVNEEAYQEVNELKPDILLFEAPMLRDNGDVGFGVDISLNNIQQMVDAWVETNQDLTLFVQPTQPLYNATHYPTEVAQLKGFVENNNLLYLNHWENWPELDDEKMKDYLDEVSRVNETGHEVWADYLGSYFVAE